jgi:hypothetical protein
MEMLCSGVQKKKEINSLAGRVFFVLVFLVQVEGNFRAKQLLVWILFCYFYLISSEGEVLA